MGNCQATDAARVTIQHPDSKVEHVFWSLNAGDVMAAHPGHYVAIIITSPNPSTSSSSSSLVKHLKLLRPDDTLQVGHVYRLVSFEDVLREFGSKRRVKLSKLLEKHKVTVDDQSQSVVKEENGKKEGEEEQEEEERQQCLRMGGKRSGNIGQWRPSLQSIPEVGS
ncbi:hypothetical protein IHE45_13G033900 [Dioscorea alata]|uniref:Uncharacterized protein n=1 Tax=Dioscorea alata TaxID=55571 RepID=A0ACB7UXC9_DIOAL|nr:hypothetical protein IHE45_U002400 [Dioscorea alata]KAH7665430.1 hypothetical protein IHE45_13G033900 [Dioscorea alata]